LVILESLACSTPVVSTKVGVAPVVIRNGENGYLVPDNSPERLADGLAAVLCSGEMNKLTIRQSALEYDWASIARKIEKEYGALLAAKDIKQEASA
jgi:D-inositol-3-phosphate glycosyltransferase